MVLQAPSLHITGFSSDNNLVTELSTSKFTSALVIAYTFLQSFSFDTPNVLLLYAPWTFSPLNVQVLSPPAYLYELSFAPFTKFSSWWYTFVAPKTSGAPNEIIQFAKLSPFLQ